MEHRASRGINLADERRQVNTRRAVLQGAEFKALWDRIKHKTTYRVQFDNEALLAKRWQTVRPSPKRDCNGAWRTSLSDAREWRQLKRRPLLM